MLNTVVDRTDNTMLSNGVVIENKFFPKKNLQSGTLRIVLTTECNYKCKYCFAEGEQDKQSRIIPLDKLKPVLKNGKEFGINKIKLTGGEPLLYPELEALLEYIREIQIPYVDLTTNISLLNEKNIEMLNRYHVNALTLSLNTLEKEKYEKLSGFPNFNLVKENLKRTLEKFEGKIRINCIIFDEDYKEKDYQSIIEFCQKNNLGMRLIEPSKVEGFPITYTKEKFEKFTKKLKKKADKVISSDCNSVEYLFFGDWYLTIMHSLCDNKICEACPKYMYIRITSDLKLKPCLSRRDTEIPIDFECDQSIEKSFIRAINYMGVGLK